MDDPTDRTPEWVSAADAGEAVGVSPGVIRSWAESGAIVHRPATGPVDNYIFVRLADVKERAAALKQDPEPATGAEPPSTTNYLAPLMKSFPELVEQLAEATDRAARAETKVEFLTERIADLREQLESADEPVRIAVSPQSEPDVERNRAGEPEPAPEPAVDDRDPDPLGDIWGNETTASHRVASPSALSDSFWTDLPRRRASSPAG